MFAFHFRKLYKISYFLNYRSPEKRTLRTSPPVYIILKFKIIGKVQPRY